MTIQEVHTQLNLRIDKIDSAAYDDVLPEELDVYLNVATRRFIKQRFEAKSNLFQIGFEQSIKRIEDLRHLIKEQELDAEYEPLVTIEGTFVDKVAFPNDYFLPIKGSAIVQYNDDGVTYAITSGKRVIDGTEGVDYATRVSGLKPTQQQQILVTATSPFHGTRIKSPLYVIQGDSLNVFTNDKFVVDKVNLTYIKTPATVSLSGGQTIDLPSPMHDEVIDIAARMILSDINSLTPAGQQTLSKVE